jgi:hypothetical protein
MPSSEVNATRNAVEPDMTLNAKDGLDAPAASVVKAPAVWRFDVSEANENQPAVEASD